MPSLIYTSQKSKPKRKSKSKKLTRALEEHKKFLSRYGVSTELSKLRGIPNIPNLKEGLGRGTPTSDTIPGGTIENKNLFTDHKWKPGKGETQATLNEIARKAAAVAPAYNKGGLVYNYDTPEDRKKQ